MSTFNASALNETLPRVDTEHSLNWEYLVTIVLPLVTIIGNWAVILAVKREKNLQNSTNYLIVSLAVADLLVGLIVMPWGIFALVSHRWTLPYVICDIYMSMDVICSSASIFNLVAISVDRYRAIKHPMQYSQAQAAPNGQTSIIVTIISVWFVAAVVGLPILFGLNQAPRTAEHETCEFHNPDFIICSSILSFYIPFIIIIFINVSIFKMIRDRDRKKRKARLVASSNKATATSESDYNKKASIVKLNSNSASNTASSAVVCKAVKDEELVVPPPDVIQPSQPQLSNQTEAMDGSNTMLGLPTNDEEDRMSCCSIAEVTKQARTISTQVDLQQHVKANFTKKKRPPLRFVSIQKMKKDSDFDNISTEEETPPTSAGPTTGPKSHVGRFRLRLKQMSISSFSSSLEDSTASTESNRSKSRGLTFAASSKLLTGIAVNWRARSVQSKHERRERRATKTLAVVLGCFLFCWIPFFACNTAAAISIKWEYPEWRPDMTTFLITTWLGYINSIVNPFIYTIFNRDFRKAFKKLLNLPSSSTDLAAAKPLAAAN